MPDVLPPDSVGIVTPQTLHFSEPLLLACGKTLTDYQLVYETYGQLNANKSNAVLICHALSGHHHAAGYHSMSDKRPGWWDAYIGPGKPIDTNKFFVVSLNNIGGCHGSTGPSSINPETGKPWGPDFPKLRVRDWVHSQARLADKLGIDVWAAVIGGSLGGMQAMRWTLEYPERVRHCAVIASALKLSAQNIAFNETIGSDEEVEFQIESYLRYQGGNFAKQFDANSYLLITKALDYFDLAREYGDDAINAFQHAQAKFLVISFSTDWRFAPERSREIVSALIGANKSVSYAEIESKSGHDAFLLPDERYQQVFGRYLAGIVTE